MYLPTPGWSLKIVADFALGIVYFGPFYIEIWYAVGAGVSMASLCGSYVDAGMSALVEFL